MAMRVLMLGWEFPPFIAGGLGVACYGLTKALDRMSHQVVFVLPKPVERNEASHVRMLAPPSPGQVQQARQVLASVGASPARSALAAALGTDGLTETGAALAGFQHAEFRAVPATFSSPYPGFDQSAWIRISESIAAGMMPGHPPDAPSIISAADVLGSWAATLTTGGPIGEGQSAAGTGYGSDLVGDSERYARLVVALARREQFDVIHAHDWLTYPAGLALSSVTGKPLVVHVHSTEFDRAGTNVNQRVYDIERAGMHGAQRVIAVSQMTRSICAKRYGIAESKVDIVYNGIDRETSQPPSDARIESNDRIVLFLGRITMQKGPEYFIAAAKRVLEKVDNVKFVLAGSGDMAMRMIEMAAGMGIGHKVLFTGFLRGRDVDRVFQMADCYVMPSVSEPFGIAALEAIHNDVPVIMSKTAGAAEVLTHVLKVDFWDIDEMANKIIAVLRHPPLSQTLRQHGSFELHRLTWEGAAQKCIESYEKAIAGKKVAPALR
jgi:glycosyltransferase involved in cell wall biosynthesis